MNQLDYLSPLCLAFNVLEKIKEGYTYDDVTIIKPISLIVRYDENIYNIVLPFPVYEEILVEFRNESAIDSSEMMEIYFPFP